MLDAAPPDADLLLERILTSEPLCQRYEVLQPLGRGGMGAVFAARDRTLDRACALKVMIGQGASERERCLREARLLARLEHPNVLRIFNIEVFEGVPVLVLELLEGCTLKTELARVGRFSVERTRAIGLQILEGMTAAHRLGIVHRDLKAENVLVGAKDSLKILDFGLARTVVQASTAVTQLGAILGTPAYMSPEQCDGKPVDARSDIYSLGVVLFELLTGRLPFTGAYPMEILVKHLREEPPALSSIVTDVPPELDSVVRRAMAKQPGARFPDGASFRDALRATTLPAGPGGSARSGQDPRETVPAAMAPPEGRPRTELEWADDPGRCGQCGGTLPPATGSGPIACATCGPVAMPSEDSNTAPPPGSLVEGAVVPPREARGARSLPDDDPIQDPAFTSRYDITGTLGRGGMGVVYRGVQRIFGREVAIKFMLSAGEKERLRFRREGHLASTLDHPNLVKVFDGGEARGHPFLVMELVRGQTLEQHLARSGGRLGAGPTVAIMDQILDGLGALHAAGAVHRDLKPANVFITEERTVKIGDFGLVWSHDAAQVTRTGDVMGTPAYMAPEQFLEPVTEPASDIYSLGVILFRMLTGRLPFESATFAGLAQAHQRSRPPSIRNLDAAIPAHLETLVAMALDKNPASRPRTAHHFKRLLRPRDPVESGNCDPDALTGAFGPVVGEAIPTGQVARPVPAEATDELAGESGLTISFREIIAATIFIVGFSVATIAFQQRVRAVPEWPDEPLSGRDESRARPGP